MLPTIEIRIGAGTLPMLVANSPTQRIHQPVTSLRVRHHPLRPPRQQFSIPSPKYCVNQVFVLCFLMRTSTQRVVFVLLDLILTVSCVAALAININRTMVSYQKIFPMKCGLRRSITTGIKSRKIGIDGIHNHKSPALMWINKSVGWHKVLQQPLLPKARCV